MAVNTSTSLGVSLICCILVFSGLQMYRVVFSSSRLLTLVAGYSASWLFIFLLTAVSNLETIMFGKGFQAKLIPEVVISLVISCFAAAMVHRVSVTVCFLCSILALYYLNKLSHGHYHSSQTSVSAHTKKKRA
ncbi:UNVERIFIED_CONTAM: hypothetical protein RMT77_004757 [Armadillidium vulgare]